MKNVLMLACLYPPFNNAGSVRSPKLAKYLPDFGWRPVVLTSAVRPQDENSGYRGPECATVYRTPARYSFFNPYFRLDSRKGYWKHAFSLAMKIIEDEKIDLLFSTSAPMRTNLLARRIVDATGLPWVAEFQDQWTDNCALRWSSRMINPWTRQREKRTMRKAIFMTSVTPAWADAIAKRHGRSRGEVPVIPNGYDEDDYERDIAPIRDKFVLTYTGGIVAKRTDIRPLMEGISLLKARNAITPRDFMLRFFGTRRDRVVPIAAAFGVEEFIEVNPRVERRESMRRQAESTVNIALSWIDRREKGMLPLKAVEYLGARRPIMAVPRNDGDALGEFLRNTNAGRVCDNAEEVAAVLQDWIKNFRETGGLPWQGDESACVQYTRRDQARRFAALFDAAIAKRGLAGK